MSSGGYGAASGDDDDELDEKTEGREGREVELSRAEMTVDVEAEERILNPLVRRMDWLSEKTWSAGACRRIVTRSCGEHLSMECVSICSRRMWRPTARVSYWNVYVHKAIEGC